MKKAIVILIIILNTYHSFSQTVLTIEGTTINNTISSNWAGVNIPRSVSTRLTYRNNSITSVNTQGYLLQAGDEAPGSTNNKLDGEVITGNKFVWNGANSSSVITHGLFVGYNINSIIKYNYLDKVPYGIIFKSGTDNGVNMTFTSGGCAYNICRNGKFAGRAKGVNGVKFINNTFYSGDGNGWYLLLITENMDRAVPSPSKGTKVFNNIFYSTSQIPMIKIESGCLVNFECDYNIYWCTAGEPRFSIDGGTVTWAQWRARGYDAHSRIMNPNFINYVDFVPSARLDFGTNMGSEWQSGLSTTATWVPGVAPSTTLQNGIWQVGARIYSAQSIYISHISVTGANGSGSITADNGTLQLSAVVSPSNATNKNVTWSIVNGTGQASVNSSGLVTAISNGTVTAKATATDGSGVSGTLQINISGQIISVSGITVTGAGGASIITSVNGTLQLSASVRPSSASNKNVTWSVIDGTGSATINSTGLITALSEGTVTAYATAADGSGVSGSLTLTIASQLIPVSNITVTGSGGATSISSDNGTLQLGAVVLPSNATDNTITWSIVNVTGQAVISPSGMVTALANGTVTAVATANDGSGMTGSANISVTSQIVPVTSISVFGEDGLSIISVDGGSLQLYAGILPDYSTDKTVGWSIVNGTGNASITSSGLVTGLENGTVTARATANDGSGKYGTLEIIISGQIVPVTTIIVSGEDGTNTINSQYGLLQLHASVLPSNATSRDVTWSLVSGSDLAVINSSGLLTAMENGTVTVQATANDGSGVSGTMDISINHDSRIPFSIIVTSDEMTVIFHEDLSTSFADLYNLQGTHVMRKTIDSERVVFRISHLAAGLYLLVVSRGELLAVQKVMLQ